MSFPADIKGCMKDCILSLFWPRTDIVGFFEKHGCTKGEVGRLQIEGENGLKRGYLTNKASQIRVVTGRGATASFAETENWREQRTENRPNPRQHWGERAKKTNRERLVF
jgi:hypothetical protein